MERVKILMERRVGKHRLCLVRSGSRALRIDLELWMKTSRRKSPWDRCRVGTVEAGGVRVSDDVNWRALPHMGDVRRLAPEFDATATVATVSLS